MTDSDVPESAYDPVAVSNLAEALFRRDRDDDVRTDGGRADDRPDPADDPFVCSMCGVPLTTLKRISGSDYCDSCARDVGSKPPLRWCISCQQESPQEIMETIDVSADDEYYPKIRYLCPRCSGRSDESDGVLISDGGRPTPAHAADPDCVRCGGRAVTYDDSGRPVCGRRCSE